MFINPVNAFAEELILAGGCFWCLEHDLESLSGINFVQSGYSGGDLLIRTTKIMKDIRKWFWWTMIPNW